jgi:hypothetical protein
MFHRFNDTMSIVYALNSVISPSYETYAHL